MIVDTMIVDFSTSELTIRQVLALAERLSNEHPDREYFLDGDAYGLVERMEADA